MLSQLFFELLFVTDVVTVDVNFLLFQESDSQFRYIALELCSATLQDFVEKEHVRSACSLDATTILKQAAEGLAHLHSLKIGQRPEI